jgi:hypothetical protein
MDHNRRYSERDDDRENPHPNTRNLQDNHRIGKEIYRDRGHRDPNERYQSGQSFHNQNEGYSREQTHYGARPDSAYRDQSRINYGDNRQHPENQQWNNQNQDWQNQRYGQNQDRHQNQNRPTGQNQNYRGQQSGYGDQRHDYYNNPPQGEHAGTRFWGEREGFKEDDYRYTSGNRGNWEAPGTSSHDRDEDNRNRYRSSDRHQDRDQGFFDRMGNSISNAWNSMTGNDDDKDNRYDNDYRNRHPQNRNFNRGYESGPRWADEDDRHNRDRENRRRRYDD